MSDQSSSSRMPWAQQEASDHAEPEASSEDTAADVADTVMQQHGEEIAERVAARTGVDLEQARAVAEAAASEGDRREAMQELGVHMTSEYAEKVGIDVESAEVARRAESLATLEGRRQAMQELGVHMSGRLAERYGVEDAEAQRLMDASRALRTPEGRAQLMAEYAGSGSDVLVGRLTGRDLSIEERREAMSRLLDGDVVKRGLQKTGRGILVGGIIALVVLIGVLIGAVALLGALTSGGAGETAALSETIATRPDAASFVAGLRPA